MDRRKKTPLSNAERQRRWREKQKQKNEDEFLQNEAKRERDAYVPVENLNSSAKKTRREEGRKRSKKWYDIKKTKNLEEKEDLEVAESLPSNSPGGRLVVKLPTHKTKERGGLRKIYRRSLRKAYRQNEELSFKNKQLQRANKRLHKRIERIKKDKLNRRDETTADETDFDYLDEDTENEREVRKETENSQSTESENPGESVDNGHENLDRGRQISLTPK